MSIRKTTNGEISSRLLLLINKHTAGNVTEFARNVGLKQASMHNYIKGRTPNVECLNNICNKHHVNLNWLITGKGDIYINDTETVSGPCDVELLKTAIELVEDALESAGREMDSDKKAELVAAVYDLITDNENMEIKSRFSNVINLVTKAVLQQNTG